ncbi:MAG TPA: tRNA uridine-5-carboxymethylaminomethyl(34) synthesis GTPase MnmE [Candidatus Baltobacteraceae bacterium]
MSAKSTQAAPRETIAAIATPPGRGAIAIVRMSGEQTRAVAARVFRSRRPLRDRVAVRGEVVARDGAIVDQALALLFAAPRSYTGEDVLELHVHGSPAVATETLLSLLAAGARLATPGEFTRRAFLAGKLDLTAAEAVGELIAAEHRSQARAAVAGLSGGLAREVQAICAQIAVIVEELAASLDFPDEVDAPAAHALMTRIAVVGERIEQLAQSYEHGRLVREGVRVAIVGPPNAGKSSLLNALLGVERALVSELAGTTRDTIEENVALAGFEARLVDTAGIRAHADRLERAGIERAEAALATARIALVVVDASEPLSAEATGLLERTRGRGRVVLFNKSDLGRRAYDARDERELDALLGCVHDEATLAALRRALEDLVRHDETPDLERPHLANARQVAAVIDAKHFLDLARETLRSDQPTDLAAGDLLSAMAALHELTGRDASEALLDGIFARFCIGK